MKDFLLRFNDVAEIKQKFSEGNVSVVGLGLGEATLISSFLPKLCFVADGELEKIAKQFEALGRKVGILDYASDDFCLHTLEFGSRGLDAQNVLFSALTGEIDVLVVSPQVCGLNFAPRKLWQANSFVIDKSGKLSLDDITQRLTQIGYTRVERVEERGQWAKRGDVLDVFPVNSEVPYRVHFWDVEVEKITKFNVLTQFSTENVASVYLAPNGFSLDDNGKKSAVEALDRQLVQLHKQALKASNPSDFEANLECFSRARELILSTIPHEAWQFCACFTDFVSLSELLSDFTFVFSEPRNLFSTFNSFSELCISNLDANKKSGQLCSLHHDVMPSLGRFTSSLMPSLSFMSILTQNKFATPKNLLNFSTKVYPHLGRDYSAFCENLKEFCLQGYQVVLNVNDVSILNEFKEKVIKHGLKVESISQIADARAGVVSFLISELELSACFTNDKLLILGAADLRFERIKPKWDKKIVAAQDEYVLPKAGDYVVHAFHGIGVCEGVKQLSVGQIKRDYVVINYKNNDKVYVPTEQMDLLGRYIGGDKPQLSSIGSNSFEKVKQHVRESVKELAFDLLSLYRKREQSKGLVMRVDDALLGEFADSFPYTPTPDQEKAILDVYSDLASGRVMDRLVVGDVGFGKTEVALRAAFVAVMSGYQVVLIAPTTILAEQHYNTFSSRLNKYGVEVASLTRFKTKKEQEEIIAKMQEGKLNVLIGTHRVLSDDVKFDNLGLLILDEEQRFGVGDKDKLKTTRTDVHVLTLSATPIPRTLHMSLVGIRDISTIETPPLNRQPVQTVVSPFSYALLSTAIRREKARNGQSFVVYPRVETIEAFTHSLRTELNNELTMAIVHGQMDKKTIEGVMKRVYNGEIDVLIATTLIENGIDLPNANTLFVVGADKLGLSQLYQLRGRVGRSNKLAWAYFTYENEQKLSNEAYQRLSVLTQFTSLGSGFKIAMRDLEIRGAGDILGAKQHGQMEKVGYDLYCKLLNSSIASLKGEEIPEIKPVKIDVDINAYVPKEFVPDEIERMEIYSAVANIRTNADFDRVNKNVLDKYGQVPNSVSGLMAVALLKSKCASVKAVRASVNKNQSILYFDYSPAMENNLVNLKSNNFSVTRKEGTLVFKCDNTKLKKSQIWPNIFDVLDKMYLKFVVK